MKFLTRYSRLKERVQMLEKYVDDLGKAQQEQQVAGEKARCHFQDQIDLLRQQLQQPRDHLQGHQDTCTKGLSHFNGEMSPASREIQRLRKHAEILEAIALESPIRPAAAINALAGLPSPFVSVILPTHNRAKFLPDAIASVRAQRLAEWELIIVDDGSTDCTRDVVNSFLEDPRIRYLFQPHSGSSSARNRGIAESQAPFIAYLDSDNIWFPDFLQKAVDCLVAEPEVDMVYGAMVIVGEETQPPHILWEPFQSENLLRNNFIDTNIMVHRKSLIAKYGLWSSEMERLQDWELVLRLTQDKPARRLPVFAVYYKQEAGNRITTNHTIGCSLLQIQNKWFPPKSLAKRPKVLYSISHYPQLSETYIESEIRCMQRWGVHVEVWRAANGSSTYPVHVTIHDGTLDEAIAACRPDVIHLHWLSFAKDKIRALSQSGLPITLRLHGFDVTPEGMVNYLANESVTAVYAFPNQIARLGISDPRLKSTPAGFDSTLFLPAKNKDRKLVVRTAAGIPSKDLPFFLEAARRLPDFRFVLAVVTCYKKEPYIKELLAIHESMGSPAEILIDLPREEIAKLVGEAGIYVHTLIPPEAPGGTPVGQPISIAESMATGCLCLVREIPEFLDYTGHLGDSYADLEDLVEKIRATTVWSDQEWREVQRQASDHAFRHHADVVVYQQMFMDWANRSLPQSKAPPPVTDF